MKTIIRSLILFCIILYNSSILLGQEIRWLRVTPLQTPVNAIGAEYEGEFVAGNTNFFSWPAQYSIDQNTVRTRGLWIGCCNFNDPVAGKVLGHKVVDAGPRVGDYSTKIFPQGIKLIGRRNHPDVTVDDHPATILDSYDVLDEVDPNLPCDREVLVTFNTSIGISVTKKQMVFDQPNHDNYHVKDFIFKNTGIYDATGHIKQQTLDSVYFYFTERYAFAGVSCTGYGLGWGSWNSTWGESNTNHSIGGDPTAPEYTDPSKPTYNLRAAYTWYGPDKERIKVSYDDDWGDPDQLETGELAAAKYAGSVTLHADKSATDKSDDIWQPRTNHYISPDGAIMNRDVSQYDEQIMSVRWAAITDGHPDAAHQHDVLVGNNYAANWLDPIRNVGAGIQPEMAYGPYHLAPGDSIHIVMAEAVAGISWEKACEVGSKWLMWWNNSPSKPTLTLPDGSTTTDYDAYKRIWVQTGVDTILKTYHNAIKNYNSDYSIPKPPPPPDHFTVTSGGDRISLAWSNNAESDPHFGGYVAYRSQGNVLDRRTVYEKIFECNKSNIMHSYYDTTAAAGFDYFYYIQSKDDGTQNDVYPGKSLTSSLFLTVTAIPARLNVYKKGEFQTHQSGNWNDVNTWERFNGSIWVTPAPYSPSNLDEAITIRKEHTITMTTADSADQLIIQDQGKLVVDTSASLKITNGDGTDLLVHGTLTNYGSITLADSAYVSIGDDIYAGERLFENAGSITMGTTSVLIFKTNSLYDHIQNGGSIPKAIWNGGTCEITGVIDSVPANLDQRFNSVIWDCPRQNANLNIQFNDSLYIPLAVMNTNWNRASSASPSFHLELTRKTVLHHYYGIPSVNGPHAAVIVQQDSLNDSVDCTYCDISVLNGGLLNLSNNGCAITYLITGNISISDSGYFSIDDPSNRTTIDLLRSVSYINISPSSIVNFGGANFSIGASSTLYLGSSIINGSGYFNVGSSVSLETSHPHGIDGNLQLLGTKTIPRGTHFTFDGKSPQVTGTLIPDSIGQLTIANDTLVSLSSDIKIISLLLSKGFLSTTGKILTFQGSSIEIGNGKFTPGSSMQIQSGGYDLKYSGTYPQVTSNLEFPSINGPASLTIANPLGVTLHESRAISFLSLGGKLILDTCTIMAGSISPQPSTQLRNSYIVTNGRGMCKQICAYSSILYPVGTATAYAPVTIANSGIIDTIGVTVQSDSGKTINGGRVLTKWKLHENSPGGGIYRLTFAWMTSLEDSLFKSDRSTYARIYRLSDTTEPGTGIYFKSFSTEPYYIRRNGITSLDSFAVGAFKQVTGVNETENIPLSFKLNQNYPNPFNPSTTFSFDLPSISVVTL